MTAAISPLQVIEPTIYPIRLLGEATLVPAGCSQFFTHDIPHGQFTT